MNILCISIKGRYFVGQTEHSGCLVGIEEIIQKEVQNPIMDSRTSFALLKNLSILMLKVSVIGTSHVPLRTDFLKTKHF